MPKNNVKDSTEGNTVRGTNYQKPTERVGELLMELAHDLLTELADCTK